MANLTNNEPLMPKEKVANEDGTPTDYLIRYLNEAYKRGQQTVKFPVTSVNGKTGDVIIDLESIISEGGIDYDKLNDKIQELIAGLDSIRNEMINRFNQHLNDYHKYAFQGFMEKNFGDERMFVSRSRNLIQISLLTDLGTTTRVTTVGNHGLTTNDTVGFEAIESNNTEHPLDTVIKTVTVTSATEFTIDFDLSAPGNSISSLNLLARVVVKESGYADGTTQYNMPVYFPSLCIDGVTAPDTTSFFRATNYKFTTGGASDAGRLFTAYGLVVIEKTIKVKRLYIPIVFDTTLSTATTGEYALHQFGLYTSSIIGAVDKATASSPYLYDNPMRFPRTLIWKSSVLDSRNFYDVNSGSEWPNTVANADMANVGLGSIPFTSSTVQTRTLAWDIDLYLPRGIYYIARRSMKVGNRAAIRIGDQIGLLTADGVGGSADGSPSMAMIYPPRIKEKVFSPASTYYIRELDYTPTSLTSTDQRKTFSLYDFAQRLSGGVAITTLPELDDSLYSYLTGNNVKPFFEPNGYTACFYDQDGYRQGIAFEQSERYPLVGLSGIFEDREPSDTW